MRAFVVLFGLLLSVMGFNLSVQAKELVVFHAGSLSIPFKTLREGFERYYKDTFGEKVFFKIEVSGSVEAIRKVTDLKKKADIVAVADYVLIPQLLLPEYASFYILFATNEMVLAYSDKSKYKEEISSSNWYEILSRDGVSFGFSDPNQDPCGYRSLMVMKLSDLYYGKVIFDRLVSLNTNITASGNEIFIPNNVKAKTRKVVIRPKEVDLASLVESGALDYLFLYKSVAKQHGLHFLELPSEVNLKSINLVDVYKKVSVFFNSVGKRITGDAIVYGVTLLKGAPNWDLGVEFLKFMLTQGRKAFLDNYHDFLERPIAFGEVPEGLRSVVEIR